MTRSTQFRRQHARRLPHLTAAVVGALVASFSALSALADAPSHAVRPGWGEWWLPYNYSTHGGAIDSMFNIIF